MNKLLVVGLTSVVLFGVSGTASVVFAAPKTASGAAWTSSAKVLPSSSKPDLSSDGKQRQRQRRTDARHAVRPAYNPGSEEIARLTAG